MLINYMADLLTCKSTYHNAEKATPIKDGLFCVYQVNRNAYCCPVVRVSQNTGRSL